jgi:hypothetical protein
MCPRQPQAGYKKEFSMDLKTLHSQFKTLRSHFAAFANNYMTLPCVDGVTGYGMPLTLDERTKIDPKSVGDVYENAFGRFYGVPDFPQLA